MSRLSLNQRFWIVAIVLAAGTMVLAALLDWHSVQDHRRHVRSIELLGALHGVIGAGDRILDECAAAEALMGVAPARQPRLTGALGEARGRTDAALATMAARVGDLPDGDADAAEAHVRATRLAVERARGRVDALLAVPVPRRTRAAVEAAIAAEERAVNATTPLLDRVAGQLIRNDAGRAGGVNTPRLQVYLRDATNREIALFIPALATGTPLTAAELDELAAARIRTDEMERILARLLLVDPGDTGLQDLIRDARSEARARTEATMDTLIAEARDGRPYSMSTAAFMARTLPLTSGLHAVGNVTADRALAQATAGRDAAYRNLWLSLVITALVLGGLVGVLMVARRSIFVPLSAARASILALARGDDLPPDPPLGRSAGREVRELFAAIDGLRDKERRRVVLEDERAAIQAQLRHEAATDALTGLFNRRTADAVGLAWAAGAEGAPPEVMGAMLVDVDHFKAINDTFGHLVGDRVLQIVAARLAAGLRSSDLVARFGGEELLILVTDVSATDLAAMADGLRRAIADDDISTGDGAAIPVRVSIGIARAARGTCTWPELISAADSALYRAKAGGRNRVEAAATPEAPPVAPPPATGAV